MKSLFRFMLALILILAFNSCNKESDQLNDQDQLQLAVDEAIEQVIVDDVLKEIDLYSGFDEGFLKSAVVTGCPAITVNKPTKAPFWPRTIIMDYGTGCTKNDHTFSGKMIIEKSAPWTEPGSVRKVTFQNYKVDDVLIEGNKEFVNKTKQNGPTTFSIAINLTMTYPKDIGKVVKRTTAITQVWVAGFNDPKVPNEYLNSGGCKIETIKGTQKKIVDKDMKSLRIVQDCRFPQGGVASFTVNTFDGQSLKFDLDYGVTGAACGSCDCMAALKVNGKVENIDLSKKWWDKVKK